MLNYCAGQADLLRCSPHGPIAFWIHVQQQTVEELVSKMTCSVSHKVLEEFWPPLLYDVVHYCSLRFVSISLSSTVPEPSVALLYLIINSIENSIYL